MNTNNLLSSLYNTPYITNFNHGSYFRSVSINTFLDKFNINTNTCKEIRNSHEFKRQMKILHFLIHISFPLVDNKILHNGQYHNIDKIKLSCYQNQMPLHWGAMGDGPHFSLEIKVGGMQTMCHLYLDGTLTSMYFGVLSQPQTLESFDYYVSQNKKTLNPKAKEFKPEKR